VSELERRRRGEAGAGILAERRHVVLHHEGRPPIREPARYPPPYKSVRFCMESGRGFNGVTLVQTWRRGDCWPDFLRESADRQRPPPGAASPASSSMGSRLLERGGGLDQRAIHGELTTPSARARLARGSPISPDRQHGLEMCLALVPLAGTLANACATPGLFQCEEWDRITCRPRGV